MGSRHSADEGASMSFVSTTGWTTEIIHTPSMSRQSSDEFELVLDSDDEDSDASRFETASCCSTSASPSIFHHEFDHGRRYHNYKSGRYPLPNDIGAQECEALVHHLSRDLVDGYLFLSDIGEQPRKILDIGTGSGLWALDVADQYPCANVIGTDLSPIQPSWLPVNVSMFVDDCEDDDWLHGSGFDLIHFRGIADVLRDMDSVLAKAHANLRAGGWVEFQDIKPRIFCDDLTMKSDDPLSTFTKLSVRGMKKLGCGQFGSLDMSQALDAAGFVNVQRVKKKVPVGSWPQNRHLQSTGALMKTIVQESLGAYAAKPLAAVGLSKDERKMLVSTVKASLEDTSIHRYVEFNFVYGQKEPHEDS